MCGAVAMVVVSALSVTMIGATAALLGIAVFTWIDRPVGAGLVSADLGGVGPVDGAGTADPGQRIVTGCNTDGVPIAVGDGQLSATRAP